MKRVGFTIVELLIVIVVISILTTLTVVAFNGIQYRAENSRTLVSVDIYHKALMQYKVDNGTYPATGELGRSTAATCLGEYAERPPLKKNECIIALYSGGVFIGPFTTDNAVNASLQKYIGTTPRVDTFLIEQRADYEEFPDFVIYMRGITFMADLHDHTKGKLSYPVRQGDECGRGVKQANDPSIPYESCVIRLE